MAQLLPKQILHPGENGQIAGGGRTADQKGMFKVVFWTCWVDNSLRNLGNPVQPSTLREPVVIGERGQLCSQSARGSPSGLKKDHLYIPLSTSTLFTWIHVQG